MVPSARMTLCGGNTIVAEAMPKKMITRKALWSRGKFGDH